MPRCDFCGKGNVPVRCADCVSPRFEPCRRCGHQRYLNQQGYCSPDCERGLTPLSEYTEDLRRVIQGGAA